MKVYMYFDGVNMNSTMKEVAIESADLKFLIEELKAKTSLCTFCMDSLNDYEYSKHDFSLIESEITLAIHFQQINK